MKHRLDQLMAQRGLTRSRSEAESWIKLGRVTVDGKQVTKPGYFTREDADVVLKAEERYVSRAGLKLASVAKVLGVEFQDKVVLDVGSSTGGFTDYALQHGATKVYAVDVGTDQLHLSLRSEKRIDLHEKTDIRDFTPGETPDVVVMDVSFISLREILPHIAQISTPDTQVVAMVKPQFEAQRHQIGSSGVIKNDKYRREILKDFELWIKGLFVIVDKADSEVAGATGNRERFYLLAKLKK
jgi:23S rRNA (cytidine1920-2'-O)/16S rRNA (cytidine1409-2'-O)-methyltransferase